MAEAGEEAAECESEALRALVDAVLIEGGRRIAIWTSGAGSRLPSRIARMALEQVDRSMERAPCDFHKFGVRREAVGALGVAYGAAGAG